MFGCMSYREASEKLGRREGRKVGNNTYLERLDEHTIGVRLHSTYVVKIADDDTYTLDSGGWQTVTTKDRLNVWSPVKVFSDVKLARSRGRYGDVGDSWFVKGPGEAGWSTGAYDFYDGMVVDPLANVVQHA